MRKGWWPVRRGQGDNAGIGSMCLSHPRSGVEVPLVFKGYSLAVNAQIRRVEREPLDLIYHNPGEGEANDHSEADVSEGELHAGPVRPSQQVRDAHSQQQVRDANSQRVRDADSQQVCDAHSQQQVRDANSQQVRDADSQQVRDANSQQVRDADSQQVCDADSQQVRDADSQQVCDADSQQVRDADSQQVRDADSQQVRDAVCAQAQVHATGEVREVHATGEVREVCATGEVRKAYASALQVASIQVRLEAKTVDAIEYGWQVGATGHLVWRGRTSRFVDPSMMAPIGWPYRTTLMQRSGTWFLLEHCVPWADLKDTEAVLPGGQVAEVNFIFACAG